MSGRIRSIKPELLEDERAAALSDRAWRLFVSALLLADDYGNLRASAKGLHAAIWWARDDVACADVEKAIQEIEASKLLELYQVRDQFYAHVRTWAKHQRMDNAGKARVPAPSEGVAPDGCAPARNDGAVGESGTVAGLAVSDVVEIVRVQLAALCATTASPIAPSKASKAAKVESPSGHNSAVPSDAPAVQIEGCTADAFEANLSGSTDPSKWPWPASEQTQGAIQGMPKDATVSPPPSAVGGAPRPLPKSERAQNGPFWIATYERAVEREAGHSWSFPRKELPTLERVITKWCTERAQIDGWLDEHVGRFVRAVKHEPTFWSAYGPNGFERWWNLGCSTGPPTARRPGPTIAAPRSPAHTLIAPLRSVKEAS